MRVVLDLVSVLLPVVLSLSLSPATTAVADEDLCGDARRCENGGVCVLADPASVVNATTEEDHRAAAKKRCLCPGGWTGATCEEEVPCDLDCGRHGGVCAFRRASRRRRRSATTCSSRTRRRPSSPSPSADAPRVAPVAIVDTRTASVPTAFSFVSTEATVDRTPTGAADKRRRTDGEGATRRTTRATAR